MLISLKSLIGSTSQDDYRILVTIYIYIFIWYHSLLLPICFPTPASRHRWFPVIPWTVTGVTRPCFARTQWGCCAARKAPCATPLNNCYPGEPHRGRGWFMWMKCGWVNTYRYILVGWTSINTSYDLGLGTRVLTHLQMWMIHVDDLGMGPFLSTKINKIRHVWFVHLLRHGTSLSRDRYTSSPQVIGKDQRQDTAAYTKIRGFEHHQ